MADDYIIPERNAHHLMMGRLGVKAAPRYLPNTKQGIDYFVRRMSNQYGLTQQDRMIRDKRRTLDRAVKYSYQGAFVKKYIPDDVPVMEGERDKPPVRALINPNKLKQDYDDKILSVGYEFGLRTGDVFEWIGTETYWLIYLQDLDELAYFRGDIRKCSYEIAWEDDDGNRHSTYAAVRGPVETKINFIQKHGISVDEPNYSLDILMPLNDETLKEFQRYSRFYLQNDEVCWRVEAIDWISTPNILEVVAVEYYANETDDDIDNGIAGGLVVKDISPNTDTIEKNIVGETFIKPKKLYEYEFTGSSTVSWSYDEKLPLEVSIEGNRLTLRWISNYSGQFDLIANGLSKTIVVESLF